MVVANATTCAWDRRDGETRPQYEAFRHYLTLARRDRSAYINRVGRRWAWSRDHEWPIRAAAYDDNLDREYEEARREQVREMRDRHASVGRMLVAYAVSELRKIEITKPADLIRLADLGRKMEFTAMLGHEGDVAGASHVAISAAGVPVDEWDRLAADLAATVPR